MMHAGSQFTAGVTQKLFFNMEMGVPKNNPEDPERPIRPFVVKVMDFYYFEGSLLTNNN